MSNVYFIDLFCGAGGTSSGIHRVNIPGKKIQVIACINHDKNAIISHSQNHPSTLHFTEDIRTIDLSPIVEMVKRIRQEEPSAIISIWASLECTNFSKAKGGKPRDADSRTLAEHLFRYLDCINPEYLWIENVVEFMAWGDLDEKGKPVSMDKGNHFRAWVEQVKSYGFEYEHRLLNAADYGVPQSRKRLFIQFSKLGIKWAPPTHSKDGKNLPKWKAVRNCLDLNDKGASIFEGKPRSEKTLERIYYGLIKFVAGGEQAFLVKYNSFNAATGKYIPPSLDNPCPTVSTQGRLAVCNAFVSQYFSGKPHNKNKSIDEPSPTVTTVDHSSLVQIESDSFISLYYGGDPKSKNKSIDEASPSVLTKDHHSLVQCEQQFIQKYYSTGKNIDSVNNVCATVTTKDRMALVSSEKFIYRDFTSGYLSGIDQPSGTVMTVPKLNLVSAEYILNPQWGNKCCFSVDRPSPTVMARQDKTPLNLVSCEKGNEIVIEEETPWSMKIKETMRVLGISDIKMRMFRIKELLKVQDFSDDYVLVGTQAEQKKYIGNAVPVGLVYNLIKYSYQ